MIVRLDTDENAATAAQAMPEAERPCPALRCAMHAAIVLAILASNYFLRCYLDEAGKHVPSFMEKFYAAELPELYALSWWEYLLPVKSLTGAWQATSILLVHGLEHLFGNPVHVFYFTNAVLIVVCYNLSWHVFRSFVFSITFTMAFAWSTFNHHVYIVSGSVALPLIVSYTLFFLFCQYKLLEPGCNYWLWGPVGVLGMAIYALAYESWLDCVTWMWLAYPFLIVLAYRAGDYSRAKIASVVIGFTTLATIGYVVVKTQFGHGQQNGSESDVVLNYGLRHGVIAIEDVIVHWFTLVFIAITTYSPPFLFNGSMSSWRYGTQHLIDLQHGYHENMSGLVGQSHVFLWRYYAGFASAVLLYALWKNVRANWRGPTVASIAIFVFLLMTLMPGTTHMLVKYRPMHSAPFLSYHSYFGIIGFTLLLSYVVMWINENVKRRWLAWAIIGLVWFNLGYCALARPAFLSHMAVNCGFTPYPDAWQNLKKLVRR